MRHWPVLLLSCIAFSAQAQVRINELKCTRTAGTGGQGPDGDWLELYNAGPRAVDLANYVLALDGRLQPLPTGMIMGPGQYHVFWCDQAPELGPDHLPFSLPRKGGSLLLVAPDRTNVLDIFNWPELPPGTSIGRKRDGAKAWGFFPEPSPGQANTGAVARLLPMPEFNVRADSLSIHSTADATPRYTLDGSVPDDGSPLYTRPLRIAPGTVVTARNFAANGVPSPCAVFTTATPDSAWALVVAPKDWTGPVGIADVPSGNHARKGKAWQRQAWLQRQGLTVPVGLSLAGSGSRSLPKRNFKLLARDRFGSDGTIAMADGSTWHEVLLRADATPHAFLRNLFMEEVARRSGGRVDVQPSFPLHLFLNGKDQGLYRVLPAKGKEWLRRLNDGQEVDIIEGPGAQAVAGNAKSYMQMLRAIAGGAPLNSLSSTLDAASLVEMACFDLWTGRADHELNVRCWRPRQAGGRWRWVMYDMDQWAPPEDRTVQRMSAAGLPETPFLPQLLADHGFRDLLLARISALMATTLSPDRSGPMVDSLYARHRAAMAMDRDLWQGLMEVPSPEEAYSSLLAQVHDRNRALLGQLAKYTGAEVRTLDVKVEPAGAGRVMLEDLPLTGTGYAVKAFTGVTLHLRAVPGPGMEFAGWKGAEGNGDRLVVAPVRNMRITALFRPVAVSRQGGLKQRLE